MSALAQGVGLGIVCVAIAVWVPRPDATPEELADAQHRTAAHIAEIQVNGKPIIPGARMGDGGILVVPDGVPNLAVVVYPTDGVRTVPLIEITATVLHPCDLHRDGVLDIKDINLFFELWETQFPEGP